MKNKLIILLLFIVYSSGEGVSMDIDKAIQYYKKSALLGDSTIFGSTISISKML